MPKTILNGCCPEITWRVGPFPHGALQCAPTWPTQECGDVLQIPRGAAFLYQSSPVTTPDPCNFSLHYRKAEHREFLSCLPDTAVS